MEIVAVSMSIPVRRFQQAICTVTGDQNSSTRINSISPEACGSSPQEALSRGCKFDTLSFAWQVPDCFDPETINGFTSARDWRYYTNESGKALVDESDLELDHQMVHVSSESHVVRCAYQRQQMLKAWMGRMPLDGHIAKYGHTVHCANKMLDIETPLENLHTAAPVIYPVCKAFEEWRL
jgi:hypothetical protein